MTKPYWLLQVSFTIIHRVSVYILLASCLYKKKIQQYSTVVLIYCNNSAAFQCTTTGARRKNEECLCSRNSENI